MRSMALPQGGRAPGLQERPELRQAEMHMAGPGAASDTEKLFLLRKWSLAGGHPSPGLSLQQQPSCGRMASRRPVVGLGWGPCPQMCSSSCAHPWRRPEPPGGAGGLWVCHCGKAWEALSGQRWWRKVGSVLVQAPGRLFLCMSSRGCHMGESTRGQCACWILISGYWEGAGSVITVKGILGSTGGILTLPFMRGCL